MQKRPDGMHVFQLLSLHTDFSNCVFYFVFPDFALIADLFKGVSLENRPIARCLVSLRLHFLLSIVRCYVWPNTRPEYQYGFRKDLARR